MKRRLSLLLAVVMILGSFSFAFAAEETVEEKAGAFLKKVGVLEGINGELKLEDNLRRQDAVVLVARLHGAEEEAKAYSPEGLTFTDFKDPFYRPIIKWAVDEELVEGHTAERFGFNEDITVQQYATILLRALGYNEEAKDYDKVMELAEKNGLLKDVKAEAKDAVTRGQMAVMTFNALGQKIKGTEETLAEKLGIEMPEAPKADKLTAKVLDTENLAEIVVELSNAKLVKNTDALLNPANYRLSNGVKVQHVHLDGDNVVLTLVPYGKVEEQEKFDSLIKGKKFHLTIRNIDPAINTTYYNITPGDNSIPVVEEIDFIGTHGIKIVTSEPIANPLERNFRLDSRTSMIVEQYGRNIILTPYHGKEFAKDAVELTIDKLEDFAGYTSTRTVEKMTITDDEGLPKVEAAYRSGKELVVEFDRDVYHNSVKAYNNRRALGNASFVERRVSFYAEKAEKIDTNVVKYTFTRDIPRGMEVTIEGVANHFNKAMEKQNIVPVEYKDDYAPAIIDFDDAVTITNKSEKELAEMDTKERDEKIAKGYKVDTLEMGIVFDKDIAEFKNAKAGDIKVADHFTLYELDITKRGETIAKEVEIKVADVDNDSIELTFEGIKINNKDRDFDYILEVRNFSDTNRNRMEREYLDFQVVRQGTAFDVVVKDIKNTRYFNRNGVEIVLEFNKVVNKEAAQDATNYELDGKLAISEAIVERDGKTVSLVVYDTNVDKFLKDYKQLQITAKVKQLDWPYSAPARRLWNLETKTSVEDENAVNKVINKINALPKAEEITELNDEIIKTVKEAREAYDALTKSQKALVPAETLKKLTDAEAKVAELGNKDNKDLLNKAIAKVTDMELEEVTVEKIKAAIEKLEVEEGKTIKELGIDVSVEKVVNQYKVTLTKGGAKAEKLIKVEEIVEEPVDPEAPELVEAKFIYQKYLPTFGFVKVTGVKNLSEAVKYSVDYKLSAGTVKNTEPVKIGEQTLDMIFYDTDQFKTVDIKMYNESGELIHTFKNVELVPEQMPVDGK